MRATIATLVRTISSYFMLRYSFRNEQDISDRIFPSEFRAEKPMCPGIHIQLTRTASPSSPSLIIDHGQHHSTAWHIL